MSAVSVSAANKMAQVQEPTQLDAQVAHEEEQDSNDEVAEGAKSMTVRKAFSPRARRKALVLTLACIVSNGQASQKKKLKKKKKKATAAAGNTASQAGTYPTSAVLPITFSGMLVDRDPTFFPLFLV
jgi:hypothetical protein